MKKAQEKQDKLKSASYQEQCFRDDFFKFSKSVCNGSFGAPMKGVNFSKDTADKFFVPKYGTVPEPLVDTSINWFPFIPVDQM